MGYIRSGECNQCGECCGYPRKTNGGQNNAWPADWPASIKNWNKEVLESELPVFKLVGSGDKKSGRASIGNRRCSWIWVSKHGLCKKKSDTYDQRCPFLSDKLSDGTVPCLLYNTDNKYIWDKLCQPVPPERFESIEQVENFFKNCPSCSYIYNKE